MILGRSISCVCCSLGSKVSRSCWTGKENPSSGGDYLIRKLQSLCLQLVLCQVSYAIGVAEPLSIHVDSYGTGKKTDSELLEIIRKNFDLRPGVIVR